MGSVRMVSVKDPCSMPFENVNDWDFVVSLKLIVALSGPIRVILPLIVLEKVAPWPPVIPVGEVNETVNVKDLVTIPPTDWLINVNDPSAKSGLLPPTVVTLKFPKLYVRPNKV